jgi:methylglutaconyl-CoA hydratase
MAYQTILPEINNNIATIWLNRPELRNAFNHVTISELLRVFKELEQHDNLRAVILRGKGKSFCAGADLNWMREVKDFSFEQNLAESLDLSDCLYAIYTFRKPVIAVVHGAAIGGANGLLAACDIAICEENTIFSLSEVKIGIIPACISPYVIKRVGEARARELMLTGKRIKGAEAERYNLVNRSLPESEIDNYLSEMIGFMNEAGPEAVERCKVLIDDVINHIPLKDALAYTARMIAEQRLTNEAQEGMAAFLEKRKPNFSISD